MKANRSYAGNAKEVKDEKEYDTDQKSIRGKSSITICDLCPSSNCLP